MYREEHLHQVYTNINQLKYKTMEVIITNVVEQRTTSNCEVTHSGLTFKTNNTMRANRSELEEMSGQVFRGEKQIASFTRGHSNSLTMTDVNDTDGLAEVAVALTDVFPALLAKLKGEKVEYTPQIEEEA